MASVSFTFRKVKMPSKSIPGKEGRTGAAPGDNKSLSYFSLYSSPLLERTTTSLLSRSILITSE